MNPFGRIEFLTSASQLHQLPPDEGAELAFAGRSNAGKSSAINAITGRRGLARTSRTPGRTQLINFFRLTDTVRLVDLPGYGYAKVPEAQRRHWGQVVSGYLQDRRSLRGVVVIMDARRPLGPLDLQLLELATAAELPCHLLLTKADKLGNQAGLTALRQTRRQLGQTPLIAHVQLFSALKGTGVEQARAQLAAVLALEGPAAPPADRASG
ncbi:MAG: ribosome biogenesis GTP-binding protein YihA/YsxC [Pseudomonadota bacterium]|nr:ribosome biogenesis GTP-binding protein YihA/YsxC [Pseudomonadota bacterium]HJO35378.1 ribosome biogenesis GTP-binding protein YihA/YsxC [Gammaproteobacteria bacterium]